MKKVGGLSELKKKDDLVQKMIKELKDDIQKKLDKTIEQLDVDSYKTQIVAGTNYFIKVQINNEEFIIVKVFQDLPHNQSKIELVSLKDKVDIDEHISYF